MPEHQLIHKFYTAFKNLDAETMVSLYDEDVIFQDPAFGVLKGQHAGNMWRMLCQSQKDKDFKVTFSKVQEDKNSGQAHWEAFYTFSATGRKVHNKINATFVFKDGMIIKHTDEFDLHKWAGMALGFKGKIIGGTNFFRKKLNTQTGRLLEKFEQKLKP